MLLPFPSPLPGMLPKKSLLLLASLLGAGGAAAVTPDTVARLYSCDQEAVRAAADALLDDPDTLRQPVVLFHAAMAERAAGRPERAVFFHLAGRLRGTRQALVEGGDAYQAIDAMVMSVGPFIMPLLGTDPDLGRKAMHRVLEWDKATPDPYRDRLPQATDDVKARLAKFEAGFAQLPETIAKGAGDGSQPRRADARMEELVQADRARRCGPGTIDAAAAPAAVARIDEEVERLVTTHALVLERAGGAVGRVAIASRASRQYELPHRYTVSIAPPGGKTFYAEVDVKSTVGADRRLGEVRPVLACLTDLWIGQREAFKDVCSSDPQAIRPD
jgi:hypothetical protein